VTTCCRLVLAGTGLLVTVWVTTAVDMGSGVRGKLMGLLATDMGTGSVGRDTVRGNWLVDTLVTPLFCSNNTGWVFLTLSGGRGWVGSWMGKVCLTAGAGVTWATAGLLVVGTVTAGTTLVMVVGLTWSLRGGSTVGWGIPALVTWDWDVTRVRVTEEAGVVSLTACPVLGSIRSSGC